MFAKTDVNASAPHQSYFQKQMHEQKLLYDYQILKSEKRLLLGKVEIRYGFFNDIQEYNVVVFDILNLAKAHMRESIVWHEEAIRQHSFCRKFSKDDYLHHLLRYYHDMYIYFCFKLLLILFPSLCVWYILSTTDF